MGLRGWPRIDDVGLVALVETGLPISTADTIARKLDPKGAYLEVHDLIPKATYYRRKKLKKPLTKDQSEMIYALSKVFSEAIRHYHDDKESASLFLSRKHPLLGGRSPLDVARESTAGADLVMDLFARAEAGVAI
jgi:putative toxin-antitoxin system antitoxin component (TIGR02293 family)